MTPNECMKLAAEAGIACTLQALGRSPRIRLPMDQSFLKLPLDELSLSVRSRNALMRADLDTIGKLVTYMRENGGLNKVRNLGKKSILEVKLELVSAAYSKLTEHEKLTFWKDLLASS